MIWCKAMTGMVKRYWFMDMLNDLLLITVMIDDTMVALLYSETVFHHQ